MKAPKEYWPLYERDTCQKCGSPVTKKRMMDCRSRSYFPVCAKCEKKLTPMIIKAQKMMAEGLANFKK